MRLLVNKHKNPVSGEIVLMSTQALNETENINYEIIDNPPLIENKEGFYGEYFFNNTTNSLDVRYLEIPKTQEQILNEKIAELTTRINEHEDALVEIGTLV